LFQGHTKIVMQKEVMPGIQLLQIEAPEIAGISEPGQFVMLTCDSGSERLLRRPISIHKVEGNQVYFLYAVIGEGTKWLALRKAGENIDVLGPMGHGFSIYPESRKLMLAAGGMGIAPLVFLAQKASSQGCSVTILIGARTASLVIPGNFIPQGVTSLVTTEDGSTGLKGMVTSLFPEQAKLADQIFICGPLPMYRAINHSFIPCLKDKPTQVSLEVRMGCGLGFCYACTIKTLKGLKQVCKDGPVFNLDDVIWDELK
jgi:dihydroorotate dehydrogenase electron transfer subunit